MKPMPTLEQSALAYITRCKIDNCTQEFTQGPPLIGEEAAARAQRMFQKLAKHVQAQHPNHWQRVEQQGKAFASFMTICQFEFQDPWCNQFRDALRHGFFKSLQRFKVSDQKIAQMVGSLQLPDEYQERVLNGFLSLRNVEEEITPEPAAQPEPASTLTQ